MKQMESIVPEKERNSYWEGSPAAWKKWLGRTLLALLVLYYGWGLILLCQAGHTQFVFVAFFVILPFSWPFWLVFLVEQFGVRWIPLVVVAYAVLMFSSVRIQEAKTRRGFLLSILAVFIVFLLSVGGCVAHANGMTSWSP